MPAAGDIEVFSVVGAFAVIEVAGGVVAGLAVAAALFGEIVDAGADGWEIDVGGDGEGVGFCVADPGDVGAGLGEGGEVADGVFSEIGIDGLKGAVVDD